jgi:hypothetical protein
MLTVRQYAALGDEFLLAAVPYRHEGLSHHFLVVPVAGGPAQLLTAIPGADSPDDLQRAWNALQATFNGSVPSPETFEQLVAKTAVAQRGHAVTKDVTN